MGYRVKWVEENLGVTRDALKYLEKKGLIPKNENRKYREYSDDDLRRIWLIRILQGIGYTPDEILDLINSETTSIDNTLPEKIRRLEKVREKIDVFLGYAKMIKLSGRFPSMPKDMGSIKFDEFYRKSIDGWNIKDFHVLEELQELTDEAIKEGQMNQNSINEDIKNVLDDFDPLNPSGPLLEASFMEKALCKSIIRRMGSGTNDQEVQALVSCMYENLNELLNENKMTKEQFGRIYATSFVAGDMARLREKTYGKEGCEFIANAMAIFGGYKGIDDAEVFFGKER